MADLAELCDFLEMLDLGALLSHVVGHVTDLGEGCLGIDGSWMWLLTVGDVEKLGIWTWRG